NDTYSFNPAIDINSLGDIGMTFLRSASSGSNFMSMYVTGRSPLDGAGAMQTPKVVPSGHTAASANYSDTQAGGPFAGQMSGISLDPTPGNFSFWVANEFATDQGSPDNWST